MQRELRFLLALWKANLQAAMEYRAAFLSQVVGMILNNAAYFTFWILFFDRFQEVRGWNLNDMVLLFSTVAASFGLAVYLFGNVLTLADIIAGGKLDYYLALPRPVLLHVLASRSIASGLGDFSYGLVTFLLVSWHSPDALARFLVGLVCGGTVLLAFLVLVQSLAFTIGNASQLSGQAVNAMLTFAMYPLALFDGNARLLLFMLIPAAFLGSVPVAFTQAFSWPNLLLLAGGAALFLALALLAFYRGLRRYESGSAMQIQV
ncbi:MAG: ABC-2 family transporter protein [Chloroflexaceae bacterium]|jgi:ABC-2 type transport system permease protein|nr:ABC-2 family transporter protein [Chloroflexaceae bacterium]